MAVAWILPSSIPLLFRHPPPPPPPPLAAAAAAAAAPPRHCSPFSISCSVPGVCSHSFLVFLFFRVP